MHTTVGGQRKNYKLLKSGSGKMTPMTMERAQLLIDTGFEWTAKNPRHLMWEVRFPELKDFQVRRLTLYDYMIHLLVSAVIVPHPVLTCKRLSFILPFSCVEPIRARPGADWVGAKCSTRELGVYSGKFNFVLMFALFCLVLASN